MYYIPDFSGPLVQTVDIVYFTFISFQSANHLLQYLPKLYRYVSRLMDESSFIFYQLRVSVEMIKAILTKIVSTDFLRMFNSWQPKCSWSCIQNIDEKKHFKACFKWNFIFEGTYTCIVCKYFIYKI